MELIDRKALINQLKEENIPFNADINEIINIQPIAFDMEKVVEQLMIIHDEGYCPNEDGLECILDKACSDCYREKIIDIVKKGGVE